MTIPKNYFMLLSVAVLLTGEVQTDGDVDNANKNEFTDAAGVETMDVSGFPLKATVPGEEKHSIKKRIPKR